MSKGWMGVLAAGPVSFLIFLSLTSPAKALTLAMMVGVTLALAAVLVHSRNWMGVLAVDAVLIILAAVLYFTVRFGETQAGWAVAGAGIALCMATLTRYDGWFSSYIASQLC